MGPGAPRRAPPSLSPSRRDQLNEHLPLTDIEIAQTKMTSAEHVDLISKRLCDVESK